MKMQCDVCQKAGASVFCAADEAALCDVCDHSVHHANKLAGKHHRFSLLVPSPDQIPLCDICQEKRAFLFCQQDRAILCRNCDASIHKSNEHTQKHNRFLLTGIKLSVDSELFVPPPPPPPPSIANGSDNPPIRTSKPQRPTAITNNPPAPPPVPVAIPHHPHNIISNSKATAMGDRSSMSEYLIEMLPGWPVENLLDSSSPSDDFCKTIEPLWDHDIIGIQNQNPFLSYEKTEICVPPYTPQQQQQQQTATMAVGMKNQKEGKQKKSMAGKKRDESFFIVPEIISQPNSGFKRYRTNLW